MEKQVLKNSKVLVTGGAGFIGSNLVDRLLAQNNKVVCLDNFSTGNYENLSNAVKNPNFVLITGDIRNYSDCQIAVQDCDFVFHQAALGSVPRSVVDPVSSSDVNIGGFVKILTASKEAGVKRFIYASSSSVYGDHQGLPKVEHLTGKALSPYAVSKSVNELFARNFSEIYGIETIGLRYFNVYGFRQNPNGEYAAVIPRFVSSLIKHNSPIIYGDGSNSRDFTFVDDVIKANQLAAIVPTSDLRKRQLTYYASNDIKFTSSEATAIAEVFNIAYGSRITLTKLADTLKDKLARYDSQIAQLEIVKSQIRKGDIPHSLASIEKAKSVLGFYPEYNITTGLEMVSEWYFKNRK